MPAVRALQAAGAGPAVTERDALADYFRSATHSNEAACGNTAGPPYGKKRSCTSQLSSRLKVKEQLKFMTVFICMQNPPDI